MKRRRTGVGGGPGHRGRAAAERRSGRSSRTAGRRVAGRRPSPAGSTRCGVPLSAGRTSFRSEVRCSNCPKPFSWISTLCRVASAMTSEERPRARARTRVGGPGPDRPRRPGGSVRPRNCRGVPPQSQRNACHVQLRGTRRVDRRASTPGVSIDFRTARRTAKSTGRRLSDRPASPPTVGAWYTSGCPAAQLQQLLAQARSANRAVQVLGDPTDAPAHPDRREPVDPLVRASSNFVSIAVHDVRTLLPGRPSRRRRADAAQVRTVGGRSVDGPHPEHVLPHHQSQDASGLGPTSPSRRRSGPTVPAPARAPPMRARTSSPRFVS